MVLATLGHAWPSSYVSQRARAENNHLLHTRVQKRTLDLKTVFLNALLPLATKQSTIYRKIWIPCSPFLGQTGMSTRKYAHPIREVNSSPCSEELCPTFSPRVSTGFRKAPCWHSCHVVGVKCLPEFNSRLSQGNSVKLWLEVPEEAITLFSGKMSALQKEQWRHCSNAVQFCTLWQTGYLNKWVSI